MSALRLALRGLRARAGLSAALLVVTTFAVGVAAAGAIYLRAAGESLLAQNLRTATSHTAGLHVSQVVADGKELRSLTQSVAAAGPAVPALAPPVTGLETRTPVALRAEGGRPGAAYLASRDGICVRLVLEAGRCPASRPLGVPAEAALSRRAADWLRLGLGDRLRAEGFGAGAADRDLVVAAIYTPTPYDPYWFGAQPAYFPPPPTGNELPPLDAVFLAGADLLPVIDNGTLDIRARFDHFVQPERLRLADTAAVPPALGKLAELLRINNPNAVVLTGLADVVAKAEADRQALTVPVLLADVQLASLALLILVVVAAMAAEARAGEVALAKVRGATTAQAFGLAVLELAVIAAVALPAGIAVGWSGAYLVARSQLEARHPGGRHPGGGRGRPGRHRRRPGRGQPGQPGRGPAADPRPVAPRALGPGRPAGGRPGRGAAAGRRGRPGQPARLRDPPGHRRLRPARHPRPRPGRAGRGPDRRPLAAAGRGLAGPAHRTVHRRGHLGRRPPGGPPGRAGPAGGARAGRRLRPGRLRGHRPPGHGPQPPRPRLRPGGGGRAAPGGHAPRRARPRAGRRGRPVRRGGHGRAALPRHHARRPGGQGGPARHPTRPLPGGRVLARRLRRPLAGGDHGRARLLPGGAAGPRPGRPARGRRRRRRGPRRRAGPAGRAGAGSPPLRPGRPGPPRGRGRAPAAGPARPGRGAVAAPAPLGPARAGGDQRGQRRPDLRLGPGRPGRCLAAGGRLRRPGPLVLAQRQRLRAGGLPERHHRGRRRRPWRSASRPPARA